MNTKVYKVNKVEQVFGLHYTRKYYTREESNKMSNAK